MAKSKQSFNKREKEKQRIRQRQDKQEKMEERKAAKKEKSLDDMMAYLDEDGNLTSTPPDPLKKKVFEAADIEIGVPKRLPDEPEDPIRKGVVSFFNSAKGFGFIKDRLSGESVFVHQRQLTEPVAEGDAVSFEVIMEAKGPAAVNVRKEN